MTESLTYAGLQFSRATRHDSDDILKLLRENPLGGRYAVTMEREPDPFATDFGISPNHLIVLARNQETGEVAGMCERTVFKAYVNGKVELLPYLGGLRADPAYRNRIAAIKGGFRALWQLGERAGELPYALTSITSDNDVAQRLLTAGLEGLPRYEHVGEYVTSVFRTRSGALPDNIRHARDSDLPAIVDLLNRQASHVQFAAAWTVQDLRALANFGLPTEAFLLHRTDRRLNGCIAVWDQTAHRQIVVRRYPKLVKWVRPFANLAGPLLSIPKLPRSGEVLRLANLTHVAVENEDVHIFSALIHAALVVAKNSHVDQAALGMAKGCNLCHRAREYSRTMEYNTSLYLVHWPDAGHEPQDLGPGLVQPELGLL